MPLDFQVALQNLNIFISPRLRCRSHNTAKYQRAWTVASAECDS